jgi:hypothetical protein
MSQLKIEVSILASFLMNSLRQNHIPCLSKSDSMNVKFKEFTHSLYHDILHPTLSNNDGKF